MTLKQYLGQAYRLEQRIKFDMEEIGQMQELAVSVSSPVFEEHYNATKNTVAPFVHTVEKIIEYQDRVNDELERLVKFRNEVTAVIDEVMDKDERMVLKYRYIKNYTWARIGDLMYADERTIRRWHNRALKHLILPQDPTVL